MPKTIIELPRSIDVKEIRVDVEKGVIIIDHRFLNNQALAPVAHLTCEGTGGMKAQAVLYLSGHTGVYRVCNANKAAKVRFDLQEHDFKKVTEEKAAQEASEPPKKTTPK